jgi:hypothetical protein
MRRRAPALAFGLLAAALSYAPTSNLLFASGVALAERALYFAAIAPAAVCGVVVATATPRWRRVVVAGLVALLGTYAVRTVTRIPFWRDSRTVLVDDLLQHPDNFRAHARIASVFAARADTARALAEYRAAEAIFPLDPFMAPYSVPLALGFHRGALAREEALHADSLEPNHPAIARLPVDVELAIGSPASALTAAGRAAVRVPDSPLLASLYVTALRRAGAPRWRELAALARVGGLEGRFTAVGPLLDSLAAAAPVAARDPAFCTEVRRTIPYLTLLRPDLLFHLGALPDSTGRPCLAFGPAQKVGAPPPP